MENEAMPDKDGVVPPEAESPKLLDKATIEAIGAEIALEISAAKEPEKAAKPESGFSAEALERQRLAFDALESQAGAWRERISAIASRKDLDAVTRSAASNGKYTRVPGFVVGNALIRLLRDNAITDSAEIAVIKERAYELQSELDTPYLAKQAEFYPAPLAAKVAPTAEADPQQDWISRTREFSIPLAKDLPSDGVRYETFDGRSYLIVKRGSRYHIDGPGIEGGSAISLKEIHERAVAEGWRRSKSVSTARPQGVQAPQLSDPVPVPDSEAGNKTETLGDTTEHLSLLRKGEGLRYTGRNNQRYVITRVSDQEVYRVESLDEGDDGVTRLHHIKELAGYIFENNWRFRGKNRVESVSGMSPKELPVSDDLGELPFKIEKRLASLKPDRELVYEDESGAAFSVSNPHGKDVFSLRHPDDTLTMHYIRDLVNDIREKKWKFKRTRNLAARPGEVAVQGIESSTPALGTETLNQSAQSAEAGELGKVREMMAALAEGAVMGFIGRSGEPVTVERRSNQYQITSADGDSSGFTYDLEHIANIAVEEGWKDMRGATAESVESDFLKDGETGEYTMDNSPMGSVRRFKRVGNFYHQIRPEDGSIGNPYSEAQIQQLAKEVGLKRVVPETPESIAEAARKAEALAALDTEVAKFRAEADAERSAYIAKKEEQTAAKKRLSRIFRDIGFGENLDEEVLDYKQYYENALSRWKNAELERLRQQALGREELHEAMAVLVREFEFEESERLYEGERKARLERTSKSFFERTDELWKESKVGISKEDGSMRVEVAWSRLKYVMGAFGIASQAGLEKAVKGVDTLGEHYNKLARGKHGKLILFATVVGAGGVAFGTGGTALAGVLAAKRVAAGAGFAVTARGVMDRYADKSREKEKANIMNEDRVKKVMRDVIIPTLDGRLEGKGGMLNLEALSEYLDKEGIKKVQSKARRRRMGEVLRKGGSYVAGAAIGGLIPREWFDGVSFGSAAHAATAGEIAQPVAEAASAPLPLASAPVATPDSTLAGGPGSGPSIAESSAAAELLKDTQAIPAPATLEAPESLKDTRVIPVPTEVSEGGTEGLLKSYEVKPGDSIWKIATKSVEGVPDMDKRSSGRFAKLLALRLEEKLTVIDPKLAEAAGFTPDADGRFTPDHILAGAKLELGKLLSVEEMAKLVEEAKSDSPIAIPTESVPVATEAAPLAAESLTEAEQVAIEEARVAAQVPSVSVEERSDILSVFEQHASQELIKPDGNVMKYIETLPREEQEKLFRNFKKLSVELFQTNEVMGSETYEMRYDPVVHPELAKTNMATILADHKLLGKNPFVSYDRFRNPLHGSQMEEIAKFSKAVAKLFGPTAAAPKAVESVQEYVLRMAAIAGNQQVKIPGFRMVN